jgi:hypothetical protein
MGFQRMFRCVPTAAGVLLAERVLPELGGFGGGVFDLTGQFAFVVSYAVLLVILAAFWLEMGA